MLEKPQESQPVRLELTESPEGLPAIEIKQATPQIQKIIRRVMAANRTDDPDYQMRKSVGAFLQGNSGDWMLIEFWHGTPEEQRAFVEYVNKAIQTG